MKQEGGPTGGSVGSSVMGGQSAEASKMAADKKQYSDKVDLNDLDWEDRERVLRLLFSKMNAGIPTNASKIMAKQIASGKHQVQNLDYSAAMPPPGNYDD